MGIRTLTPRSANEGTGKLRACVEVFGELMGQIRNGSVVSVVGHYWCVSARSQTAHTLGILLV